MEVESLLLFLLNNLLGAGRGEDNKVQRGLQQSTSASATMLLERLFHTDECSMYLPLCFPVLLSLLNHSYNTHVFDGNF